MLLELHVRNLALIEKADLEFNEGLTVLTGETGAGKSILIDSISVALGAKTGKGIIRNGAEYAYIELVFDDPDSPEGYKVISRRITPTKSIAKINDETVTAARLRELTGSLIDMHGQFEHQSLIYSASHLDFIDRMSGENAARLKELIAADYYEYESVNEKLKSGTDAALREREADILSYEIEEIKNAELKKGEEEELLTEFRRMKNASRISSSISQALRELDTDAVSRAVKSIGEAVQFDEELVEIRDQLSEVEALLSEAAGAVDDYAGTLDYDEEHFNAVEERLDIIHRLQSKYSDDIDEIFEVLKKKEERLEYLSDYDAKTEELIRKKEALKERLEENSKALSAVRRKTSEELVPRIINELEDLNFLGVKFDIKMETLDKFTASGKDEAIFMISTNPGQPIKPLKEVASGGELSRIMLALKTVLADIDEIDTLIFDEIDAGISGRTAQKVAEKLHVIGKKHQVLCITHLPQIAAMADNHYMISKSTDGISTKTVINKIEDEESVREIARLISGAEITEASLEAARQMKRK